MRLLLTILLLFITIIVYSQQKAGLLNINTNPTSLPGNKFTVIGVFSDPTGVTVPADVDPGFVLWKGTAKYTVESITSVVGSTITMVVLDDNTVGFLTTGVANLGNVNTDGTVNIAPTGDSNSSYLPPNSHAALTRYNLLKTATKLSGDSIVASINVALGNDTWQTGGGSISDLGVGETINVYAPNHNIALPDWGITPIYQKNDTVFREANLLHKDSIYTLFVIDTPDTDTLTIQKSGYFINSGHGLSRGTYYMDFWNKVSTSKDEYLEVKVFDVLNDSTMALGNGLGIQYRKPARNAINEKYAAALEYATTNGYTHPSDEVKELQNTLLTELTTLGILDNLDYFYLFSNGGQDAFARINLADTTRHYCLKSGDILHHATKGYGIDPAGGTGGYMNPQYRNRVAPNGQAVHSSQNDACHGAYITQLATNKNYISHVNGTTAGNQLWVRGDANRVYGSAWSTLTPFLTFTEATGLYFVHRTDASTVFCLKDGISIGNSDTPSSIYNGLGGQPDHYFFASSATNQNTASYKDVYIGMQFSGKGSVFTGNEVSFNTLITDYFTALNSL